MSQLTDEQRRTRSTDLNQFIETLRAAAKQYRFGIEAGVQVEIYDRTMPYEAGKPFAVLMVDDFKVVA